MQERKAGLVCSVTEPESNLARLLHPLLPVSGSSLPPRGRLKDQGQTGVLGTLRGDRHSLGGREELTELRSKRSHLLGEL